MLEFLTHAIEQYGYVAITLIVALEGVGLPLPGETIVLTAAAYSAHGSLSVVGVALSATLGTLLGGTGGYWVGRVGGRGLLLRYEHLLHVDTVKLARAEAYFERHGVKTVFFARFVALLRIFGSLFAGVAHMPFPTFSMVNLAGGALWAVTFSVLGYVFGRHLLLLEDWIAEVSIALAVIVVLAIGAYWMKSTRDRRRNTPGI
jgi:membrane protein DedA with SNARE-associated domain